MKYLVYITLLGTLFLGGFNTALGYAVDQSNTQNISDNTNRLINGVLKGFAPGGAKEIVNQGNLVEAPQVPSTASGSFSNTDILDAIKAIVTLTINLFFVVIEVVVQILQALLSVISNYQA